MVDITLIVIVNKDNRITVAGPSLIRIPLVQNLTNPTTVLMIFMAIMMCIKKKQTVPLLKMYYFTNLKLSLI